MKRIQDIVDKYRKDPVTRKAYMTLEQELNIRYKKGLAKGEEKGRKEERLLADAEKLESARAMLAEGDSKEKVCRVLKLSEAQIKAL